MNTCVCICNVHIYVVLYVYNAHTQTRARTHTQMLCIHQVLAAGKQKTAELTQKLKEMAGSSMAANFTMDGGAGALYKKEEEQEDLVTDTGFFLDIGQRDRKSRGGYNIDQMYRDQMGAKKDVKPQMGPKMPKHLVTPQFLDFQFYNTVRIDELYAKRRDWWHRYQVLLKESEGDKKAKKEEDEETEMPVLDGKDIDENEGWTNEEKEEAERLQQEGFSNWTKKDFSVFKSACERHGRHAYDRSYSYLRTYMSACMHTYIHVHACMHTYIHAHA